MAAPKKKVRTRRKERKNIERGVVHISSSFNNTMVTITDVHGNAISWASAGEMGFRGVKSPLPSQLRLRLKQPPRLLWSTGLRPLRFMSRDPAADVKQLSALCRPQALK